MSFYKRHIFFCTNKRDDGRACCQEHDAADLAKYAKSRVKAAGAHGQGMIRVNKSGCLDRCPEGPVAVVYPDDVWYTYEDQQDIDDIVDQHLLGGDVVERLKI